MNLKALLKENETNIKECQQFFDNSFKTLKEININNKLMPPKPPEISEIHITSTKFPLNLPIQENVVNFLKSGVLKPFDNLKNKINFDELFKSKLIEKFIERLIFLKTLLKVFFGLKIKRFLP